ncbi:hypothetical protein ACSBR1_005803 [Camellia fascicularis]
MLASEGYMCSLRTLTVILKPLSLEARLQHTDVWSACIMRLGVVVIWRLETVVMLSMVPCGTSLPLQLHSRFSHAHILCGCEYVALKDFELPEIQNTLD